MTPDTEAAPSKLAPGNIVEGFSERFNFILDRARWPKQNRMTIGAKRFAVAPNTFKHWMVSNRIPCPHASLVEVAEQISADIPGKYDARAVVGWLLGGDAVPNPFREDNTDNLKTVSAYLEIKEIANNEGINYDALPYDARLRILNKALELCGSGVARIEGHFDNTTIAVLIGMLQMAQSMDTSLPAEKESV
jgi:hypothetical protein